MRDQQLILICRRIVFRRRKQLFSISSLSPGRSLLFPPRFPLSALNKEKTPALARGDNIFSAFSISLERARCVFVWFLQGCFAGGREFGREGGGAPGTEGTPRIAAPLGRSQGPILGDRLCAYLYPRRSSARAPTPHSPPAAQRIYILSQSGACKKSQPIEILINWLSM